jgi:hypothetical protein
MSRNPSVIVPLARTCAAVVLLTLMLTGCKAKEAPTSDFISEPGLMTHDARVPFQRAYWNHKYDPKSFTEIMIAPVNTQYVMAQNFWENVSTAGIDKK